MSCGASRSGQKIKKNRSTSSLTPRIPSPSALTWSLPPSTSSGSSAMPSWPAPSSCPSRASVPPSSPSSMPPRPSVPAPSTSSTSSPRLLLCLLLLHSSSHGEPPTRLQSISHDPLFGRSKPSNREASGPLGRAHRRPRSPPVLAIVFLTDGATPRSSFSAAPSSIGRPLVPSSSSLSPSPLSDLSSSPAPSPTGSAPASRPPSSSSTFAMSPSPASHPSSHSVASSGFSLAILKLASLTSISPATSSADPNSASHRCPDVVPRHCIDVIPRRPPLASCHVAIVGYPGRAAVGPPPPLPLSSREIKEEKPPWIDAGKMSKER